MGIIDELNWKIAKENLPFYAKEVLGYDVEPFHKEWMDALTTYHRTCHVSSRDHGKSTIVSISYPLWVLTCNPVINPLDNNDNNDIILVSNSLDQSTTLIDRIKTKIEDTEALQSITWAKTNMSEVRVKEKGNHNSIISKAFGSSGCRGPHPRILIVDDPLSETSYTNEYTHNFYFNSLSGMISPTGYQHVVGTRFAFNDLYNTLSEPERGYYFKEYPALDENNNPLWKERYSYEALMQKKREIGNLAFAREYMCNPINSDASIFPNEILERAKTMDTFEITTDNKSRYLTGYDLAIGAKTTSDYFVATTVKNDFSGAIKIADIFFGNMMDYEDQVAIVDQKQTQFHPIIHYIENNGYQAIFEKMIVKKFYNVRGRTTTRQNKENSIFRIRSMLENGTLELPYGDARTREVIDRLTLELAAFGYNNGKLMGVGKHDDMVMSLAIALEGITEFKGVGGSAAVNNVEHPLGLTGDLEMDLSLPWESQIAIDLGINTYSTNNGGVM